VALDEFASLLLDLIWGGDVDVRQQAHVAENVAAGCGDELHRGIKANGALEVGCHRLQDSPAHRGWKSS